MALLLHNLILRLAWSFFGEPIELLDQSQLGEVKVMLNKIETTHKLRFLPGYNPKARCIRLNLDPVKVIHRPFLMYLVLFVFLFPVF